MGSEKWAKEHGKEWNRKKATKAFHRLDTNKDGYVSPEEKAAGKKTTAQKKKKTQKK